MRALATILAATLASATVPAVAQTPAPAALNPLIADLNSLCIAAVSDPARVETLALEANYAPTPDSLFGNAHGVRDGGGHLKSSADVVNLVATARTSRRLGRETVDMNACVVSASPNDHCARPWDRSRSPAATATSTAGSRPPRGGWLSAISVQNRC